MKKLQLIILSIFFSNLLHAQHKTFIVGGRGISAELTADGKVYAWGLNKLDITGTLGVIDAGGNQIYAQNVPTPKEVKFPAGVVIKDLAEISSNYFLALSCDGNVYGWGDNQFGQLGNGDTKTNITPTPVKVPAGSPVDVAGFRNPATGNLQKIVKVIAGGATSFAITDNGRLLSWGCNGNCIPGPSTSMGLLGNNTIISNSLFPGFVLNGSNLQPLQNVIQVSAGDDLVIALVDENMEGLGVGTVYSWGLGTNGSLGRNAAGTGNNTNEQTASNVARPVKFQSSSGGQSGNGNLSYIKSITTSDVAGYALDVEGYVWAWGNGGWGGLTGQGLTMVHSDPRRVVKGQVIGKGTDGKYLLAKSISAGLGFASAVTIDGKPVAWGNNTCATSPAGPVSYPNVACGGNLGNNGSGISAPAPVYILSSTLITHSDVISISNTSLGGYYVREGNSVWAWGDNGAGQVGTGGYSPVNTATLLPISSASGRLDPSPIADLPYDTVVCASKLYSTPIVLNPGLKVSAELFAKYKFTWYRIANPDLPLSANDTSQSNIVKSGVGDINKTYSVNFPGRYWVKVEYIGNSAPCGNYAPVYKYVTIYPFIQSFTTPTNLTYCGNTSIVKVNSLVNSQNPKYNWYPANTSNTVLATSVGTGVTTIDLSSVTPAGNGDKTVYVEEKYRASGSVSPLEPSITYQNRLTGNISSSPGGTGGGAEMYFFVSEDVLMDTVSIYARTISGSVSTANFVINIYNSIQDCGNRVVANPSEIINRGPTTSVIVNPEYTLIKLPINARLKGNKYYFLGLNTQFNCEIKYYTSVAGMTNSESSLELTGNTPKRDNLGGNIMMVYGTDESNCLPTTSGVFGCFFNWQFSTVQKFCDRLPVTLKQQCPCARPVAVTMASIPSALSGHPKTVTTEKGNTVTLQGAFIKSVEPISNGMSYAYYKSGTLVTPGSYTTITPQSSTTIPSKILSEVDEGLWILRVEDGKIGSPSCYREDSIKVIFSTATGSETPFSEESIAVFPNPFKDNLFIKSDLSSAGMLVKLTDASGHLITEKVMGMDDANINTTHLPNGMYVVQLIQNGKVKTYKLTKNQD